MPYGKKASAGKTRRILKGREKLWGESAARLRGQSPSLVGSPSHRPQTLNLISELLENSTGFVPMGTTLARVPEVIIV